MEKEGEKYALFYTGDTDNHPFVQIPDRIGLVVDMLRQWFMLWATPSVGGPIREDTDVDPYELVRYLDDYRDMIEADFRYIFAEGYLSNEDFNHLTRIFVDEKPHEGHDILIYNSKYDDNCRYITEPVSLDSPYYIGENGGRGYLTLKISNPEWWIFRNNKAVSTMFSKGCKTKEIDPESRGGRYAYDFVINDIPMDTVFCPQNLWDFVRMLRKLIEEKGLRWTSEEQRQSQIKGHRRIKDLDDFWFSFSNYDVEKKCKHIIWQVQDIEHGITQKYEYCSRLQKAFYGGKYAVEKTP